MQFCGRHLRAPATRYGAPAAVYVPTQLVKLVYTPDILSSGCRERCKERWEYLLSQSLSNCDKRNREGKNQESD